ncbi:hypothetical protein M0813_27601 [Anaeramoeba flamelloides]|uniref:Uncharacterized protein n=1 Tax=Anaeramoeba flamelloides TaxID=1746091 RepID=A0AAV7YAQ0_9EUKA|nr:hypothetical protein M0812_28081 [Anaeramoeba flamelloides]KAJ6236856.1 hypothetical protein M0813_27601 [Anaeramoeba flamelloides]
MFLVNWFFDVLGWIGIYKKSAKIVFLGLDNAGKTTLMHMLKDNIMQIHEPTLHPTMEEIEIENIKFNAFDLGGHKEARRLWRDYYTTVDAVVFIVDVADQERLEESKKELNSLLSCEELRSVPFLVLGNKIDKKEAVSEEELRTIMDLSFTTGKNEKSKNSELRSIEVFMCSIKNRMGYKEGFQWIGKQLK